MIRAYLGYLIWRKVRLAQMGPGYFEDDEGPIPPLTYAQARTRLKTRPRARKSFQGVLKDWLAGRPV